MSKEIVWIDDDIDVIYALVRPLERAGYHFLTMRNYREAIEGIDQIRKSNLVLLSTLMLPGYHGDETVHYPGIQLVRDLRIQYKVDNLIIILTSVQNEEVLNELKQLHVADVIRKPVRPSELKQRVEHILIGRYHS